MAELERMEPAAAVATVGMVPLEVVVKLMIVPR
jgi:hypothetical protein